MSKGKHVEKSKPEETNAKPQGLTVKEEFAKAALSGLLHQMAHGEKRREMERNAKAYETGVVLHVCREAVEYAETMTELLGSKT